GNGQGVDLGFLDEVGGFFGIGQHLAVVQGAFGANAVFFAGLAGFEGAQAAQFTFYGDTTGVGHFDGATGNVYVVFVAGRGFAVFTQGAVHHHGAEAELDGALAHGRAGAVVLVHDHRDVGPFFDGGQDEVAQEGGAGGFAGTGGGLDNDRGGGSVGGFQEGAQLFALVYVKGRHTVGMLGGVVQKLRERSQGHGLSPSLAGCAVNSVRFQTLESAAECGVGQPGHAV